MRALYFLGTQVDPYTNIVSGIADVTAGPALRRAVVRRLPGTLAGLRDGVELILVNSTLVSRGALLAFHPNRQGISCRVGEKADPGNTSVGWSGTSMSAPLSVVG